jgi:acyl-coenzyme A synthetase/AMP-(fatty) acid ligase
MKIPVIAYHESNTTLDRLLQRFLDQSSGMTFEPTIHTSVALYTHTSSASGPSNLKCVALTHGMIFRGSKARVDWWKRTWPLQSFKKVKVLGWAPWSHMMAFAHDIGAAAFITGGRYVFGLVDSGQDSEKTNLDQLLESISRVQPDVFSAVPWVVEGFMERYLQIGDKVLVHSALKRIKVFSCGGASLSTDAALWARELGLNMVNDIGMTEIGGV